MWDTIHSQRYGNGIPVILIHGFCETSAIWKPLINKLALSNEVITIDLPGFGKSPLPETAFTIADIATLVHKWLEKNRLKNSLIIGHSLGGYVTLDLAEKYPNFLNGFGLLHSTAFADDEKKKRGRNKTIEFVRRRGVTVFADSFVQQLFYVKNRLQLKNEITEVTDIAASTNEKSLIQYMEAMRDRPDRSHVLSQFKKPILFISGDQDTSVPIEKSRAQYNLITTPMIKELKNIGHMGMYEATSECYLAISQFLSQFNTEKNESESPGILPDQDLKKNLGCG